MVQNEVKDADDVSLYFERAEQGAQTEDITEMYQDVVESIRDAVNKIMDNVDCHDIKLYSNGKSISTFLHCGIQGDFTVDKMEVLSQSIKNELKNNKTNLENVHIHFEPLDGV